jgi:asparagine synthase (glutamine-hydrolysing)
MEYEFTRYSSFDYYNNVENCSVTSADPDIIQGLYQNIQEHAKKAIMTRYTMSNVPVGVLLSGGFDSSLILSVIAHNTKEPIHAFTVGDMNSQDVINAKICVEYLETKLSIDINHHIISISDIRRLNADIDAVVWAVETYDPVTIRSSIPYTILLKYVKEKTNIKVLLTGEGLDELCGYHRLFGYDDVNMQMKSVELLKRLARYDLLRCDKIAAQYNIELRHPYLDKSFMEYMLSVHPRLKRPQIYENSKMPIEKYIVRKAFDCEMLSKSILWRPLDDVVNCFTDNLQSTIKKYYEGVYSDYEYYNYISTIYSKTKPKDKEEMHYRKTFESMFCNSSHVVPEFWYHIWE